MHERNSSKFLQSWRKWNEGTPLEIIDPTLNVGPRSEIMRSIHIGLLCVQENESLRPTMAQVSMMLSNYSVSLAAPSKACIFNARRNVDSAIGEYFNVMCPMNPELNLPSGLTMSFPSQS
ncbi:RECEPTOR-LIKE SERINE/THREONINE-PROTEIN KINASE SD1-8 [Salix viminalis]|uniref:RECEPTOR-LIKE SERINE/THREONINE-PROTEIN KINASE SD1-8 n=1 Tax=Salix viminalis TaxID=40686 RepID=A0A9Q0U8E5_SALVM|nr:RECEPTOR-LIKE SERINE/THREONINE-PROTEIN KINASE SD1-8 [Salix viminalis]